ncbi:fusion protein [Ruloma virus]|uniref:Fusion glycoprotein F0 n=1 Tax=Ruloma virus TaxID=2811341 RepID=A0AAE7Q2H3_9MONO|nr:fusion protein [Ruloma virus]QRN45788.1 fusion protein [Ruloma virus]
MACVIRLVITIIIAWYIPSQVSCQLALSNLTKVGVIPSRSYNLKITGVTSQQYIVVKLMPNLENVSECALTHVANYKAMLTRILLPINDSLSRVKSAVSDKPINTKSGENFWGAVVAGIALGVASMAQITGSIALHNSLENSKAIHQMKDAISKTNQAVEHLQTSTARTIIAINALQDQINNQFVPALKTLNCEVVGNSIGLRLNQYFSELLLVFGPNLRDPALETLSIQAISQAFNRDFDTLIRTLGYTDIDLLDLIESSSIQGRIVDVNLEDYYIVIQVEYPAVTLIPDATIQLFNLISFSFKGQEWISVFPSQLLVRGAYISAIDISKCTFTTHSILCKHDTSYPISETLSSCARGDIGKCARTRVVNSHVSKFALSGGVLYANCFTINCRCVEPEFAINQDPSATNIMISSEYCREVLVDSIYVRVASKVLPRETFSTDIVTGGIINLDPIDISNEVASIHESLLASNKSLSEAKEILAKVNPKIVNVRTATFLIIAFVVIFVWAVISLIWLIYLTRKNNNRDHLSERSRLVNSHIPTISNLHTYGT